MIPICLLLGAGVGAAQSDPAAGTVLLVVGMTCLMLISGISGAVREIFALALYRFATGEEAKVFRADDRKRPFTPRRGN